MTPFDLLVDEALRNQSALAPLRVVVEKELLHHDILREMAAIGVLQKLTFLGGTCLRACHGSHRLSEDLDFTGGHQFDRADLADLGHRLVAGLKAKYGHPVSVSEPVREIGNVDTWKVRVITRPDRGDTPAQRINIDICAIPSYDARPMLLRNPYGVDMGTSSLIVQAESREEIFADKLVALALRPNRLKFRDLWDIGWLKQQNIDVPMQMVLSKVRDHGRSKDEFLGLLDTRRDEVLRDASLQEGFAREMRRFLAPRHLAGVIEPAYWQWLRSTVGEECAAVATALVEWDDDGGMRP